MRGEEEMRGKRQRKNKAKKRMWSNCISREKKQKLIGIESWARPKGKSLNQVGCFLLCKYDFSQIAWQA